VKILVIGDNCFDIALKGKYNLKSDENNIIDQYSAKPAGTGINFAVAFSKLGGKAYYFTPISKDTFGDVFMRFLRENRVLFLGRRSKRPTSIIINLLGDRGKRATMALVKESAYTDISGREFLKISSDFHYLYISSGINTDTQTQKEVREIVRMAKERKMKIFFDPQYRIGKSVKNFLETNTEIFKNADIVFANEHEIKEFPVSLVEEKVKGNSIVVIKKGMNGAELYFKDKKYNIQGINIRAVDSVGAGDVFNAAFLKIYFEGEGVQQALAFANCTAALSTTRIGVYIPTVEEIYKFVPCHLRSN